MKHVFILSLLLTAFLSLSVIADEVSKNPPTYYLRGRFPQGELYKKHWQTRELAQKVLDGRHIVVRLYKDWQEDPRDFERVSVQLKGLSVNCDSVKRTFGEVGNASIILVTAEDQQDEAIAAVLANFIFAEPYKKAKTFAIWADYLDHPRRKWWTFNDALGNPIGGATVEVFVGQSTDKNPRVWLKTATLDEKGRLKPHNSNSTLWNFSFILSHPDYGTAIVKPHRRIRRLDLPQSYVVPLVRIGTKANERSIWGVVVDPEKKPLGGVLIRCCVVYSPGRDYITAGGEGAYKTITDEQGRFRLYLPTKKDNEKIGTLIPPKSEYYVMIKPPKALGLLPFSGKIPNGRETKITLEHAGYFRTFSFEDENGPITDPNRLEQITLYIERPGKHKLWFKYDDFKAGGLFPLGTYEAMIDRALREYKFEPTEVTADNPEQLVFKPSTSKLYYGQVVNGITGKPMEGAFVIDSRGICSQRNLSMLTSEQWDALHNLPANPSAEDEGVAQLQKANCYSFTRLVRTDDNGWFEMTVPPKRDFYAFVVFEENYLSVFVRNDKFEQDSDGGIAVQVTKLFPAAKVIVEPRVEGWDRGLLGIWPKWIINKDVNPDWVLDILAACEKGLTKGIREDFALRPNKPQSFYVPAGLNLQIQLRFPHVKDLYPITIAERVNLQQGDTLDLGRQEIQLVVKVFVKVMDPTGSPVEGLPVTALSSRYGGVTHNTDENGVVQFDMAEYSQGEFVVEYAGGNDPDAMHLREAIPYEIAGPEDANSVYTLQVSDEVLYQLFK